MPWYQVSVQVTEERVYELQADSDADALRRWEEGALIERRPVDIQAGPAVEMEDW